MSERRSEVGLFVVCYGVWLVLAGLICWLLLQIRLNFIDLMFVLRVNPWSTRFIDNIATIVLAVLALGGIVGLEAYLRHGVARGDLAYRVRRATSVVIILLAVSYALHYILPRLG